MLSLASAQRLRDAGLRWEPAELDFFGIPLPGLDNQVFVLTNMTVMLEPIQERMSITFHGTTEWALDHIWVGEAIWIPREEQLRDLIEERLVGEQDAGLRLTTAPLGYRCELRLHGVTHCFEAFDASEAYAAALLYLLEHRPEPSKR
ncbi:MAG: pilus assembly protein CpaE [Caldilineae bacterium]|nr:MAG: pilus assembly protein CpaE [Caldilineae bacterium]